MLKRGMFVIMKILILTNHSYMLYRFRRELIQRLATEHEVVLSMPFVGHEQNFMDMGLRCIETKMGRRDVKPTDELKLFFTYFQLLRKERPDRVITYSIKPNIYGGLCCRLLGIPYYANVQGLGTAFQMPKLKKAVTVLYREALRKVNMVFFENESNAAIFRDRAIVPLNRQTVLPGAGINLKEYPFVPYPDNKRFHYLYLGRIMREKGVNELFDAARLLFEKYGNCFVLDIVGFFDYEDFTNQIRELEDLGIAVFHGFQSDPRPYYQNADCVLVPSYHEGMSNVLLEAAATGRPLITTDIPGCAETVDHGTTGLICKVKDRDSLLACMEQMLLTSKADRVAMGIAGHEKMVREFNRELVVSRIIRTIFPEGGAKQ